MELALPVIVALKRWLKDVGSSSSRGGGGGNKNGKVNAGIALLVQKLEANSKWIEERRAKVEFAPNDRVGVDGFLKEMEWEITPLGAFVKAARKRREEQVRVVERGRRIEEERNKKRKGREEEKKKEVESMDGRLEDEDEDEEIDDDDEEE